MNIVSPTIMFILLLTQCVHAVQLVIQCCCALQADCISTTFMEIGVLALFLSDGLGDFAQAIADHFYFGM